MNIIGSAVKKALELKSSFTLGPDSNEESQVKQLRELLSKAKNTSFGLYYYFEELEQLDDPREAFSKRIPLHNYDRMYDMWWKQQVLYPNITWPGKPAFFARSSGTTGPESKRIPVTEDLIKSMRSVSLEQLSELAQMSLSEEIFGSEALAISSSAQLAEHMDFLEGEISGINVYNMPDWYDLFYRPGKDIAAIPDWDTRTDVIADKAKEWNIGILSGIPSWVQLCLKKIIAKNDIQYIDDIWPNAGVYLSGGVAFSTYEESFKKLFRKPIKVVDTYMASEGFLAYGSKENSMHMNLALSHGYYFEFIPFTQEVMDDHGRILEDAPTVLIEDVQLNQEYVLVISSVAGAWRYIIGDVVKVLQIDPLQIIITGRTKFFLNVVGSQLSEDKMNAAIKEISQMNGHEINEFMVACTRDCDDDFYHEWVLVTDDNVDAASWSSQLDNKLKELNKNYAVARSKALKGVSVNCISKSEYQGYLSGKKKLGGQVKIPKVMKADQMEDLKAYLTSNSA